MNHRGGDIGQYEAEAVDETTARVECASPYACAFDTGIIEAVARECPDSGIPTVTGVGDKCRADSNLMTGFFGEYPASSHHIYCVRK